MPNRAILTKLLQRYWRLSRGLTLGARAVLIDPENRILLIRHTYCPGWQFPGGGVERGETIEEALSREVEEETGVVLTGKPELFGIYSNAAVFPGDHVALFVARSWRQLRVPQSNHEIAEHRLFAVGELPTDISPATTRRLGEIFAAKPRSPFW